MLCWMEDNVPVLVRSPEWMRRSPLGRAWRGILLCVSDIQTTRMGILDLGGRYGRPRRVRRMLWRKENAVVRGW